MSNIEVKQVQSTDLDEFVEMSVKDMKTSGYLAATAPDGTESPNPLLQDGHGYVVWSEGEPEYQTETCVICESPLDLVYDKYQCHVDNPEVPLEHPRNCRCGACERASKHCLCNMCRVNRMGARGLGTQPQTCTNEACKKEHHRRYKEKHRQQITSEVAAALGFTVPASWARELVKVPTRIGIRGVYQECLKKANGKRLTAKLVKEVCDAYHN